MDWRSQFQEYENLFGEHAEIDWRPVIALAQQVIEDRHDDVEVYIRVIYIIHNILVEEDYPECDHDHMAEVLKKYFNESRRKFLNNGEYLFFIGKILHISEWYFGLNDRKLAVDFQKKAMEKEPGNLLYEWAYRFSCSGDIVEGYLAHQLIANEQDKVEWLKSKGFPGEYILRQLEMSNQEYLEKEASK